MEESDPPVSTSPRLTGRKLVLALLLVAACAVGGFALVADPPTPRPTELRVCLWCDQIEGRHSPDGPWEWPGRWYVTWQPDSTIEAVEVREAAAIIGWLGPLSETSRGFYASTPETRRYMADPTRPDPEPGEHEWAHFVSIPDPP